MADGPPPRPRRTSRNAIAAVVAFAYLVLLIVVATGNWLTAEQDRQAVLQAAERSAAATALLLAEHADRTIHAIDLHMHSIAETFRTDDESLEEFIGRARLLAEAGDGRLPQAIGFAITDEAGIVRHAANPATIGLDFGRHPQFIRMASDKATGLMTFKRPDGQIRYGFWSQGGPVGFRTEPMDEGEVLGVLLYKAGQITKEQLRESLEIMKKGEIAPAAK